MLWLFLALGTIGMALCVIFKRKKYKLSVVSSIIFSVVLTIVGVTCTILLFAVENGMKEWGGVSLYGAVLWLPVVMPLIGRLFRLKKSDTMDICAPCLAIMVACLRFNCLISGCCGGISACIGSFCFIWPTQAIDSTWNIILLCYMSIKEKSNMSKGMLYPIYMIGYSVMRFFLEFLRDTPKDWLLLSHGQWFALLAIIIGVIWYLHGKKQNKGVQNA